MAGTKLALTLSKNSIVFEVGSWSRCIARVAFITIEEATLLEYPDYSHNLFCELSMKTEDDN